MYYPTLSDGPANRRRRVQCAKTDPLGSAGWRLERAAEFLQAGTLASVKIIPARHVAMTGNRPAVVAIEIRAVSPGKGGL